jgi:beta-lactamase regulating signal transducer with metallopeptidase domain
MSGFVDSALLTAVMDTALRGTFILLAALAGTALMRRNSAAARHLVWLAALAALLLLPFARGVVPEWRVLPAAPVVFAAPAVPPSAAPASVPSAAAAPRVEPSASAPLAGPAPARMPVNWQALALLAWAAGAALLALRLAYGVARVRWMERSATELTDDGWVRLTDGLARRLGLGRIVRLLREPGATVPMTWGVFRPVILLPGEADGWDDERRRVVLAHELAHVRRWDALTQWIAHLALAVYWFNPLVWVAVRRLREEREHACDDAVLEIGTRPAEYADHLLNIVRSLGSSQGTAAAALAMARRSQFEGRLLAILDNAVRRNGVSRAAGLATAAAAIACLLPLAALRPADGAVTEASSPVRTVETMTRSESPASITPQAGGVAAARAPVAADLTGLDAPRALLDQTRGGAAAPLLAQAAEGAGDPGLYAEIIRASLDIQSATDRRLVLTRLLERPDLSTENVVAIVAATRTMASDTERRIVLNRAMEHRAYPAGGAVPAALLESLRGFRSATEQRIVLAALLERRRLDTQSLASLLRVVPTMGSDTERRIVLVMAAERQRVEGAAREAYLAAARSIERDTEQALALSALLGGTSAGAGTPPPARPRTVEHAAPRPSREAASAEGTWNGSNEWITEHDGRRRALRIRANDVIVGARQWNVRGLHTGGSLLVEERVDGETRRVEAVCDGEGNPVWSYAVNGRPLPFDAAARRWMESVIREGTT